MSYAEGSQASLRYSIEATWGTLATGTVYEVRHTGESISGDTALLESQELRSDGMYSDPGRGAIDPKGGFNFEFSPGSQDDFIMAGMRQTSWDETTKKKVGTTISFSATAHTIMDSAAGFTPFEAGDLIQVSGATSQNNGYYRISTIGSSGNTITVDSSWRDVAVTASTGTSVTVLCSELKQGTANVSVSIEKWFDDEALSYSFLGHMINSINFDISPNAYVTGSVDTMGKSFTAATASVFATSTIYEKSTDSAFEGSEADILIKEGGSDLAACSKVTLSIANNLDGKYFLGSQNRGAIGKGRLKVSGEVTVTLTDNALINKWQNRTATTLDIILASATKSDGCMRFYVPRMHYSGKTPLIANEGLVDVTYPWEASKDSTTGAQIIIQR
jgi:hypothetical protein